MFTGQLHECNGLMEPPFLNVILGYIKLTGNVKTLTLVNLIYKYVTLRNNLICLSPGSYINIKIQSTMQL